MNKNARPMVASTLRRTIITILLVLVAMAGLAQSPIPESIVDTYWRNEVTGDWEIGFTESCAIKFPRGLSPRLRPTTTIKMT